MDGMAHIQTNLPGRTIEEISADIRVHAVNMARSYIAIGRDLMEAKALLKHGQWLPWLKEMGFGISSANKYMQLAAEVKEDSALAALPYSKAQALLNLPAGERESFAQANDIDSKSAAEIKRLIREKEDALRARNEMAAALEKEKDNTKTYQDSAVHWKREADYRAQRIEELQTQEPRTVKVIEAPDDYQALKMEVAHHAREMEEAAQAAEEAESRAAAAEAELNRLRREQSGQTADKFTAAQGAANTFLIAVQLLPYDREEMGSLHNRQRYQNLVKSIRDWCDEMADALEGGALNAEGAVI